MIEKMESKKSDWARGTIKEVPFWREDMSIEEYEEERNYLNQHWTDYMNNRYGNRNKQVTKNEIKIYR